MMSSLFAPLVLTLGLTGSFYDESVEPAAVSNDDMVPKLGYTLHLGHEEYPVYAVAGYESMDTTLLGQNLAEVDALSVGLGARKKWDDFSVFLETGVTFIDQSGVYKTQHEVIYTHLVGNHAVEGRNVPIRNGYQGYETTYDLDDGVFFRVGVAYHLTEHLAVTGAYRALYVDEEMTVRDPYVVQRTGGYWREDDRKNLSSVEVGIQWEF
jgi:hypothetical protein